MGRLHEACRGSLELESGICPFWKRLARTWSAVERLAGAEAMPLPPDEPYWVTVSMG